MRNKSHSPGAAGIHSDPMDAGMFDEHRYFTAQIPDFFQDRLDDPDLDGFLRHYDECSDCRDEVAIQYLIHEGLARVESGTAFNFEREMNAFVETERGRLQHRVWFSRFAFALEFVTIGLFAALIALYAVRYLL